MLADTLSCQACYGLGPSKLKHTHSPSKIGWTLQVLAWSLMVRASSMAAAMSVMFQGLTRIAPAPRDCAAPANSLSTSTPAWPTQLLCVCTVQQPARPRYLLKAITCFKQVTHWRLHILQPQQAQSNTEKQ